MIETVNNHPETDAIIKLDLLTSQLWEVERDLAKSGLIEKRETLRDKIKEISVKFGMKFDNKYASITYVPPSERQTVDVKAFLGYALSHPEAMGLLKVTAVAPSVRIKLLEGE